MTNGSSDINSWSKNCKKKIIIAIYNYNSKRIKLFVHHMHLHLCMWVRETYNDPLEIDKGFVGLLVVVENSMCKLRYIMSGVALAGDIKFSIFILRKSLQPIQQENIIIWCGSLITILTIIWRCIGIWKPYSSRWLQE